MPSFNTPGASYGSFNIFVNELLFDIHASGILLFSIGFPLESHCFSLYLSQNDGEYKFLVFSDI